MIFEDKGDDHSIGITLPDEFFEAIDSEIGDGIFKKMISECHIGEYKCCFNFHAGFLCIKNVIFEKYLFHPLIKNVIDHIEGLLKMDIMKNCSYMYLVGGYAKTPYFKNKINKAFALKSKYKINVIISSKALLSVVDGAARMGLIKNEQRKYVQIRILSKTYGQRASKRYSKINLNDYSKEFKEQNTFISPIDGEPRLRNCFSIYGKKGDAIAVDHKYIFSYNRKFMDQKKITKTLFFSDNETPKIASDGTKLGKYTIKWPNDNNDIEITTEITFENEMIKSVSYPTNMPHIKFDNRIEYVWKRE